MKILRALAIWLLVACTPTYAQNPGVVDLHAFAIGKGPNVTGYKSLFCTTAQLAVGQTAADPLCRTVSGDASFAATGVLTLSAVNANVGSWGSATQVPQLTVDAKGRITAVANVAISGVPPGGAAGGDLTGTYPSPTLGTTGVGAGGPTGSATVAAIITYDAKGRLTAVSSATITPAIGSITGLGAGCATWLGTPSSANLRGCVTDETGSGLLYFQNGDIGTPSAGVGTNLTALNASNLSSGTLPAGRLPALTGDVTSSAGSAATTLAAGNAGNLNSGTLLAARMPALTGDVTSTVNTVATAVAKINGVDQTTPWTTFVPTVTCNGGGPPTLSLNTAAYRQIGKSYLIRYTITASAINGCTGFVKATLPGGVSMQGNNAMAGQEFASIGWSVVAFGNSGTIWSIYKYDGTNPFDVNGRGVTLSGAFEAQ